MKWLIGIVLLITMVAGLLAFYFHYHTWRGYKLAKKTWEESIYE
tara:strand:- start:385 stop:516 length:132 start_codon:yes stop_codon:yes gene_type:complete